MKVVSGQWSASHPRFGRYNELPTYQCLRQTNAHCPTGVSEELLVLGTTGTLRLWSLVLAMRARVCGRQAWRKPKGLAPPSSIPPVRRAHFRVPSIHHRLLLEKHRYASLLSWSRRYLKTAHHLPEHSHRRDLTNDENVC